MNKQQLKRELVDVISATSLVILSAIAGRVFYFAYVNSKDMEPILAFFYTLSITSRLIHPETLSVFVVTAIVVTVLVRQPLNRFRDDVLADLSKQAGIGMTDVSLWRKVQHTHTLGKYAAGYIASRLFTSLSGIPCALVLDPNEHVGWWKFGTTIWTALSEPSGSVLFAYAILFLFVVLIAIIIYRIQSLLIALIDFDDVQVETEAVLQGKPSPQEMATS